MGNENGEKKTSWLRGRTTTEGFTLSALSPLLGSLIWTLVLASLFIWQMINLRRHTHEMAIQQARSQYQTLMLTRRWNAQHGGVYAPITEQMRPNPYLDDPYRDVMTTGGIALTKINPSYMTRQIAEIAAQGDDIKFHITSLNPIRPGNIPDAWETIALQSFSAGYKERIEQLETPKDGRIFRYMAPLWVERSCLKCHSKQGYHEGDLRGGISISFPARSLLLNQKREIKKLAWTFTAIWLLLISVIVFGEQRQRRYLLALIENEATLKKNREYIVERKQAEDRLSRYARELKENNEELKTFVYISSHDLRTPLVNMKGFAGELRHALQEITSVMNDSLPSLGENNRTRLLTAFLKDVPEALGFIDSSAARMEELVNAISKLSRLGRQELKPELIQVQTIVQSVLKDLQLMIEKNGIRVNVGPLPELIADRNSLQMIIGSILDNAVKYLRPGVPGEIEITAERETEGAVFSIRDNGRGIPNDEIPRIFEMFRQVGEQDIPGEGVGLACAKTLVRRHGGRIWCESTPGTGTTFYFTIPENAGFPDQDPG